MFEGIPHPYDKVKRAVIPQALRVLRSNPTRKFTRLGDLSTEMGWRHDELIAKLEARRKQKSGLFFAKQKALRALRGKVCSMGSSMRGHSVIR